jgi:sugar lactone lactonase YvrE
MTTDTPETAEQRRRFEARFANGWCLNRDQQGLYIDSRTDNLWFGWLERGQGMPDAADVQRVLDYLSKGEAEIRAAKSNVTWADTMVRATVLIRRLAPQGAA